MSKKSSSRNQIREHIETIDDLPVVQVQHRDELPVEDYDDESDLTIATEPTLKEAAAAYKTPFVFLPPAHREKELIASLQKQWNPKKPFLLRRGGGGVYPGESSWLLLKHDNNWIAKYFPEVVEWFQDGALNGYPTAYHPGALGDILSAGPIFRHLGGVHLRIGNFANPAWHYKNLGGKPYESIKPLLEIQPYIKSIAFEHGADHDLDLEHWRVKHTKQQTLTESQAEWLGLGKVSMEPWLTVNPSTESRGRVIIARSHRYRNPRFPWHGIHGHYKDKLLFIGIPEEHQDFQTMIGKIEYRPTRDLLEVAELIAGSALFIGNQSSPCWIAMGLGHPLIQEVSPDVQDSMVFRPNAQFPLQDSGTQDIVLPKI